MKTKLFTWRRIIRVAVFASAIIGFAAGACQIRDSLWRTASEPHDSQPPTSGNSQQSTTGSSRGFSTRPAQTKLHPLVFDAKKIDRRTSIRLRVPGRDPLAAIAVRPAGKGHYTLVEPQLVPAHDRMAFFNVFSNLGNQFDLKIYSGIGASDLAAIDPNQSPAKHEFLCLTVNKPGQ